MAGCGRSGHPSFGDSRTVIIIRPCHRGFPTHLQNCFIVSVVNVCILLAFWNIARKQRYAVGLSRYPLVRETAKHCHLVAYHKAFVVCVDTCTDPNNNPFAFVRNPFVCLSSFLYGVLQATDVAFVAVVRYRIAIIPLRITPAPKTSIALSLRAIRSTKITGIIIRRRL